MTAEEILQRHDLKNTGCRKYIISELLKSQVALSENEIKTEFPDLFDRVTFYRTLRTLEESGVIHKIILNEGSVKYALSHAAHSNKSIHSHFHCTVCDKVLCLHENTRVIAELPPGFAQSGIFIIIDGLCAKCNHKDNGMAGRKS